MGTDTHTGRTSCDNEGKDWGGAYTSQGMPKITANHQKLEERHGTDAP